jgi:hypothetical protein
VDRLHAQPVRCQIVIPVLFQGVHTVPIALKKSALRSAETAMRFYSLKSGSG